MRYCFDIDGTLCYTPNNHLGKPDYINATPIPFMVQQVNRLYDDGNYIIMQTARGKGSGIDWTDYTKEQLKKWGYKYHELFPMFCKPTADVFVDDKGINAEDWKKQQPKVKGIIAGAFDIIHPGYIRMFEECKRYCNHLTVALHDDPSLDRVNKLKPVQTLEERSEILKSIKYIDNVIFYQREDTFLSYLDEHDVRFLGSDYKDGSYTGKNKKIQIIFIERNHKYSTTDIKRKIFESLK
jgi:glycerol-3-phosphate cytidylyltransferase